MLTLELLPIALILAATGCLAGTLAGLLGVGGGIITVPVMYFVFQYFGVSADTSMVVATATSLAIIIPTSMTSLRAHHRNANVDWTFISRWWWAIILGVLMGGWLVTWVQGRYFTLLFAGLAFYVAIRFLRASPGNSESKVIKSSPWHGFISFIIGLFSVMVGIGGGAIGVAALTAFGYPMIRAVGTASVFGFLIALPGALLLLFAANTPSDAPVLTYGLVNVKALLIVMPLSVLFAPVGVWLGGKLAVQKLRRIFAVVLFFAAVRMIIQVYFEWH